MNLYAIVGSFVIGLAIGTLLMKMKMESELK